MFMAFKHLHMTVAILSVLFLILRFAYGMRSAAHLNKAWLRVLPHVVDGLLILSVIGMLATLGITPFSAPWLTEKLVAFILYVTFSVLTLLALRGRIHRSMSIPAFSLAVVSWLWLIHVATSKIALVF